MSASFLKLVNNKFKFNLFLFSKLPSAFLCGVRVQFADESKCVVTVPFKWLSQNPFKSTYFACPGYGCRNEHRRTGPGAHI